MYVKGLIVAAALWLFFGACNSIAPAPESRDNNKPKGAYKKLVADEHYFFQRSYPDTVFPLAAYNAALQKAHLDYVQAKQSGNQRSGNALLWQEEGPGNIGGRINTVAVHPTDPNTIYVGTASGGIFKTSDGGTNWLPIFDDQPYLAIGHIELDPADPNTVYVGTGDPNISGYPFLGDGVYKSTDAGQTWVHLGLADQRIVSKIKVHPANPNLLYAATMGLPFQKNNQRGLYKSVDGGQNWQQVYYRNDSTGVIDLILHPTDTNIIYITCWNRIRTNSKSLISGPDCVIMKSVNAGQSWQPVMNGIPNVGELSRINLEILPSSPNTLFASVVGEDLNLQGIYKTTNGGSSWLALPNNGLAPDALGGFGWYFGHVKVNPTNSNEMYLLGVDLWKSSNGGNNWSIVGPEWWTYQFHADKHDLVFYGNSIFCATDGGLYESVDGGNTWADIENIPNTQFYHAAINPHTPGVYYGGAQDNGTTGGNQANFNFWERIFGGDGFDIQFHPTDPNTFYAETQNGGIVVTNDGGQYFYDAVDGIDGNDRRNWDMPYKISNGNPTTMFAGTYRMYKSTTAIFPSWQAVSQDLTKGDLWDGRNTISVIEDGKIEPSKVFCGTSDGNVWRSNNTGGTWTAINTGLPNRYVTDLETSHLTAGLILVSHSGYRDNDFIPHIHLSRNDGATWADVSGNLPPLAINDVEISHLNDSLIFVATDGGVYYTTNQGSDWQRLGSNMPIMTIYDIEIDIQAQKLIAGTYARSMMSIPIDSLNANLYVAPIVVNITSTNDTICEGSSATLSVSANGFVNWSPTTGLSCATCPSTSASPAVNTTYTAMVSNGVNSASDTFTVYVQPTPAKPVISASNNLLTISNPDPLTTRYQWYFNGGAINGANSASYTTLADGSYRVEAFNGDCGVLADGVYITLISAPALAGNSEPKLWHHASIVYATAPATPKLHTMEIYNIAGQLLLTEYFDSAYQKDLGYLPTGYYIAKVTTDGGQLLRKVFVD